MLARTPSLFAWCRILIAILFAFDRVTADCDIDVYVPQEVLENYFENNINTGIYVCMYKRACISFTVHVGEGK